MGGCGEKARFGGEKCKIGGEKKTIHAGGGAVKGSSEAQACI